VKTVLLPFERILMRLRFAILSLLLFAVLGEPLYALTPQQKRAKAKEVQMRKREAARRKAEKQKAAKLRAAKKQRIKDGKQLLYVYTYDLRSGEALPATHVQVQDVKAKPTKKPLINKPTDTKRARVQRGLPLGRYWVYAAKIGYFNPDTVWFDHREDEDTVKISLYPETRLTFTVTDSLTSRPVAANVIVRNPDHQKIMQTTSDSLHAVLAVLLDDRLPFYTVAATSPEYYPFRDTIRNPQDFAGVVMRPKEVKSFVLRDMYFATGKTTILNTSEPALNELYTLLAERQGQRIRIVGHTDDIGSDRSNQLLSEGRAQSIRAEMVARGIDGDRIETQGRGERDPIVPNDSEENRQKNRRVEIILL